MAQRSLAETKTNLTRSRSVLQLDWEQQQENLTTIQEKLYSGLKNDDYFIDHPRELFQLRIDIIDVVVASLLLELEAGGGRGYFKHSNSSFIRRWNEGAFLPVVSPSSVQLRHLLATTAWKLEYKKSPQ